MITEKIKSIVKQALNSLNYPTDNINIIKSNRPDLCDYQYDGAFKMAKILHQNPLEIGNTIVNILKDNINFSKVECLPPGFINFTLSPTFINETIRNIKSTNHYGILTNEPKTFVIDYGGPNTAKPLHVGHLRSAIVGESIKRIISYFGHKTISDVHLGDYGLQIGQVIYGLKKENISLNDLNLETLERLYPEMSAICKEDETIKKECATITKNLQEGNQEYLKYWQKICEISNNDIKRLYDYLDVSFDYWYGESDSYKYIPELTTYLNNQKLLEESQGAIIINTNLEDTDDLPPLIFQKSNKAYIYGTTELATIYQRIKDFHPDYIIYLTDPRQSLHFNQVFNVVKKSHLALNVNLEHLPFGTVNSADGKPFKTRSGKTPKLDELFQEVKETFISIRENNQLLSFKDQDIIVNAIIKFADLQNNREKDYIFDINKFSEVTGKTGPYILYTYLRINKILNSSEIKPYKLSDNIYNDIDKNLRLHILELPNTLNNAFIYRMPSYIANYLYDLCVLLNAFYQTNHINNLEDIIKKEDWLYLLNLSNNIIKDMLELLVVQIPSEM